MKIYLAGPMRGWAQFNFPTFHRVAAELRKRGHIVISPAEMDMDMDKLDVSTATAETEPPHDLAHYMKRDLAAVCECDAVATLPGWEKSAGARLEVHVARVCGIPILHADTLEPNRRYV